MNSESKTTEDLLREMREYADQLDNDGDITGADFRDFANQLEAAMKREKAVTDAMLACKDKMAPHPDPDNAPPPYPGNAAEMREALVKTLDAFKSGAIRTEWNDPDSWKHDDELWYLKNDIESAIAAPPRNCDRFATAEDAYNAWDALIRATCGHDSCLFCCEFSDSADCACNWLFAKAEGGTK